MRSDGSTCDWASRNRVLDERPPSKEGINEKIAESAGAWINPRTILLREAGPIGFSPASHEIDRVSEWSQLSLDCNF